MAAINWIRHKHSDGRACYQRKLAEGKTRKEALRCLKRRISDAIYARLRADARKAAQGGQRGREAPRHRGNLARHRGALGRVPPRVTGSAVATSWP